jgi:hypothetical protein
MFMPTQSIIYEKKEAMNQRQMLAIVRQSWTKWREGENYPAFFIQGRCIEGESFVYGVNVTDKKKVIQKQRRSKAKKLTEKGRLRNQMAEFETQ